MKKPSLVSKVFKSSRLVGIIVGALIIAFATWLAMRIISTVEKLDIVSTFTLPEFASVEELYEPSATSYAVAVDGEIVSGKKTREVRPTASMAKMILGLAIMQAKPFNVGESGETITIDENAYNLYKYYASNDGTTSKVNTGEEISEYDALASVFLVSSNNMADTMAIWAFGSLDEYYEYATNMLKEWGINDTTVGEDASGFDPSTTSTASDMAKIAMRVMQDPVLKEIVAMQEYDVPVAGTITNTNLLLGQNNISGVKTGYIGEPSGYCLASGYVEGEHIITVVVMNAPSRGESFSDSLAIVEAMQARVPLVKLVSAGDTVGYYDSWWTGKVAITASEDVYGLGWADAITTNNLDMVGTEGTLKIAIGGQEYTAKVTTAEYAEQPSLIDVIRHVFGWKNDTGAELGNNTVDSSEKQSESAEEIINEATFTEKLEPITRAQSSNCTIKLGTLILINPNFAVENDFIATRRAELVSIQSLYGINEANSWNGDNLLDAEAATHINDMVEAYKVEYPGHTLETMSCFRAVGTSCGRLCVATGESDHHTGLTCDLIDPAYGTELDTDYYEEHIDWQWLKANSYKYGFIDRFPEAWAGGSMLEPANVDENGTTGLYETWHYRYVGNPAATEIATGKYNNGEYDSLEHYLKARGLIDDLKTGACR